MDNVTAGLVAANGAGPSGERVEFVLLDVPCKSLIWVLAKFKNFLKLRLIEIESKPGIFIVTWALGILFAAGNQLDELAKLKENERKRRGQNAVAARM